MIHALGGDRMLEEVSIRESILKSVTDKLGPNDFTVFEDDIIDRINAAFAFCNEFGVGPDEGFEINGANDTWSQFQAKNKAELNLVKGYIAAQVKMEFDPPTTGPMLNALKEQIVEYKWRITNYRVIGGNKNG